MCGILAAITKTAISIDYALALNKERGRDSWGVWTPETGGVRSTSSYQNQHQVCRTVALANMRAEPTTEWIRNKRIVDVQPYEVGDWVIVHNGTIANDRALCTKYNFTSPTRIDSWVIAALCDRIGFEAMLHEIIGSYAIIAVNKRHPDVIHFAMNYRPLYFHQNYMLSSVPLGTSDRLLEPYSIGKLTRRGIQISRLWPPTLPDRALVVCSGGLDSTVAAAALKAEGIHIELLHFDYGCRATTNERIAVEAIAHHMNVPLRIVTTDIFTSVIRNSPLLDSSANFASNEAGAEYAHEWVPARNLILTSIATGIAEAHGFTILALGANLEEAGAYPDNEPQFLHQFGRLLPFAIGDKKQLRIMTPVGNLMKHEIVKLGLAVNAPMHLTWSCYNKASRHCGNCGPCHMRRLAFQMNDARDPVFEAN